MTTDQATHTVTIRPVYTGTGRMVQARCTCGEASDRYRTVVAPNKWATAHKGQHA